MLSTYAATRNVRDDNACLPIQRCHSPIMAIGKENGASRGLAQVERPRETHREHHHLRGNHARGVEVKVEEARFLQRAGLD